MTMLAPFFAQAAVSPGRQRTFRRLVGCHLAVMAMAFAMMRFHKGGHGAPILGHTLLALGIVEGALLIGWRLTQLPRSQALEFLLVSPLRPRRVLLAEALIGIARLALVTLAGLPVLVLLALDGFLHVLDLPLLLFMPLTWGTITGLGLTAWAFEPRGMRRWGERVTLGLVVFYLLVGVLAGENLRSWLEWLPEACRCCFWAAFDAVHRYSPFAVLQFALEGDPWAAAPRAAWLELAALAAVAFLLVRAAARLQPHFHERHYRPAVDDRGARGGTVGDRPLAWWAVRRVTEYSGRINLWLAAGFGALYAAYTIAGPHWPDWLGKHVFLVFDRMGGVPGLTTALVILAAVPAAFQYGLWDSNAQDRCRRLELLLLTRLSARDYWEAAAAAALLRGRGYFAVAVVLWSAALLGGRMEPAQVLSAAGAGVILWGLYFSLGFRAFARGVQANALGIFLTVGLPLLAYGAYHAGWPLLAALTPPGSVYFPGRAQTMTGWILGPCLGTVAVLGLARLSFLRCDGELRAWYDRHHGQCVPD
jgi:hypothetical protein